MLCYSLLCYAENYTTMLRYILYCTILYATLLYSTILYYIALHHTILYYTTLHSTLLYSSLLYSPPLYSTTLYYTHYIYLYFIMPYLGPVPLTLTATMSLSTRVCCVQGDWPKLPFKGLGIPEASGRRDRWRVQLAVLAQSGLRGSVDSNPAWL